MNIKQNNANPLVIYTLAIEETQQEIIKRANNTLEKGNAKNMETNRTSVTISPSDTIRQQSNVKIKI
jgi:hypothetical protein